MKVSTRNDDADVGDVDASGCFRHGDYSNGASCPFYRMTKMTTTKKTTKKTKKTKRMMMMTRKKSREMKNGVRFGMASSLSSFSAVTR